MGREPKTVYISSNPNKIILFRYKITGITEMQILLNTAGEANDPHFLNGDFQIFLGVKV